jgi:hypothetical protein
MPAIRTLSALIGSGHQFPRLRVLCRGSDCPSHASGRSRLDRPQRHRRIQPQCFSPGPPSSASRYEPSSARFSRLSSRSSSRPCPFGPPEHLGSAPIPPDPGAITGSPAPAPADGPGSALGRPLFSHHLPDYRAPYPPRIQGHPLTWQGHPLQEREGRLGRILALGRPLAQDPPQRRAEGGHLHPGASRARWLPRGIFLSRQIRSAMNERVGYPERANGFEQPG